jgi:Holliday junction DNA helicase RuvA
VIGYLRGHVVKPGVIEAGGIGWAVTTADVFAAGEAVELHVTPVARDGFVTFYGFSDEADQRLFDALCKVTRVGPGVAIAILRALTPGEFVTLVRDKNAPALSKVPGVGKKTAETIISFVNLPDDIEADELVASVSHEVVTTLCELGFNERQANLVVSEILAATPDIAEEALVRSALTRLRSAA